MWWHGRGNSGGSWLPEDKKANMWQGWEIVVAHGRLPTPALIIAISKNFMMQSPAIDNVYVFFDYLFIIKKTSFCHISQLIFYDKSLNSHVFNFISYSSKRKS